MHRYRTHTCGELRAAHVGPTARLSGWVHRKRDHGHLLFLDLRDNDGVTQCVLDGASPHFALAAGLRLETVVTVTGRVVPRAPAAVNPKLATGEVELVVDELVVESAAEALPLQVNSDAEYPEDTRLRYRYLDLRRERVHRNILLRSQVIAIHPAADDRRWLHRVPDADPDLELAGGRPRLPRAEPRASRQVLRAAAGAPAVQAAPDGGGLRPLLPDRPVLPRRGRPRRPVAG